jgi:hypothetical protein
MKHTCHARGCPVSTLPKYFMCRRHWAMLPKEMRDAVWREYHQGQEVRKDPTPEYLEVTREAINWLWNHEQELAEKKAPKQGDLFTQEKD